MNRNYLRSTVKKLFAVSGNECAMPGCEERLVAKGGRQVLGHICHIRSGAPNGPRYDENYDVRLIDSAENLVLMCKAHHAEIDTELERYRTEVLIRLKHMHESIERGSKRLSNAQAELFEDMLKTMRDANEAKLFFDADARLSAYNDKFNIGLRLLNRGLTPAFAKDYFLLIESHRIEGEIPPYPPGVTYKIDAGKEQRIPLAYLNDVLKSVGRVTDDWIFKAVVADPNQVDWSAGAYQENEFIPFEVHVTYETLYRSVHDIKLQFWLKLQRKLDGKQPAILAINY